MPKKVYLREFNILEEYNQGLRESCTSYASQSDLNIVQPVLDHCHKHHFASSPVSVKDLKVLYRLDCEIRPLPLYR